MLHMALGPGGASGPVPGTAPQTLMLTGLGNPGNPEFIHKFINYINLYME